MSENQPVTVFFHMWGQRCQTECESEEVALRWLSACSAKGWLYADEIVALNGAVLLAEDELRERVQP